MPFKICLVLFLNGFKDSLYGCVKFFQRQKLLAKSAAGAESSSSSSSSKSSNKSKSTRINEKLYKRLFESCILNGVFLFLCMLTFNYVLIPSINWLIMLFCSNNQTLVYLITNFLNPFLEFVFSSVWVLPVFLLSKIFNLLWHQEIADIAYRQKYENYKIDSNEKLSLSGSIADTIFSCIMELIFLIQGSLMGLIPLNYLSRLLAHIHLAFLYSLYAFEYKWFNMSWDINKRIDHIESRWPYYFGFGLSLSIILSFMNSYMYSATMFAFIFPAYILSAIESNSENLQPIVYTKRDYTSRNNIRQVVLKLPLFRLSLRVTDVIFKIMDRRKNKRVVTSTTSRRNDQATSFTINKVN